MLNVEIVREWAEALESGRYTQGKKLLRSADDAYCCLGVLCDVVKDRVGTDWIREDDGFRFSGARKELPHVVVVLTGILSAGDGIGAHPCCLACANDEGESFATIASWIREAIDRQEAEFPSATSPVAVAAVGSR